MRILLTTPTYPPFNSGLGNAVAQQAAYLTQAGHEVVVATGGVKRESREVEGILVETFDLSGADCWLNPIRGEIAPYTNFLQHNHWDIVLFNAWQNWATDLALRHIEKIPGHRFVYSHCISTNVFYQHQPLRSLFRYMTWRPYWHRLPHYMKRLDGMLFLAGGGSDSRFDDLYLARQQAIPFRIIPNSLSRAALTILSKPALPLSARDRLIAVGSYQWQKGFDFVLRAYATSQARHRFNLHLYGQQHSSFSSNLRSLIHQLGLREESVVFHEGVSKVDLITAYSQARLILSGSHTECQPLALLDASATGTPFVARSTGCIDSMPGGITVRTPEEMALQLNLLIDGGHCWQSLVDKGRQAAQDIYHPDHTAQQLIDALSAMGVNMAIGIKDE